MQPIKWYDLEMQQFDDGAWCRRDEVAHALAAQAQEIKNYAQSFALYYKASMDLVRAYKATHLNMPASTWPDATVVNVWAASELERLRAEIYRLTHPAILPIDGDKLEALRASVKDQC